MPFNHPPFTDLFVIQKTYSPETTRLSSISTLYHDTRIISRNSLIYSITPAPTSSNYNPCKASASFPNCFPACVPGRDVIGVHSVEFKMFLTNRTDSILFGISSSFLTIGKCSDAENFFFSA